MTANEHGVESWQELHTLLFDGMWNEDLGLFRSSFAYRGNSDAAAPLSSGLVRLTGDLELERQLMRAFRKQARQDAVPHDTDWDRLALGQHHGLPTRLLDWTYSSSSSSSCRRSTRGSSTSTRCFVARRPPTSGSRTGRSASSSPPR